MDHMQNKKQIFVRKQLINADHNFQKLFMLQLINCFSWIMNRFLICVRVFSQKRVISSLKHLWRFYLFRLPTTASFTFSSALLSVDTYIASYRPEFH